MTIVMESLTVVCALACIVSMVLMVGFDHYPSELRLLHRVITAGQSVFIVNIVYHIALNRGYAGVTLSKRPVLMWVVDIAMLVTLFPLFYPRPAHPWIGWAADVVYNTRVIYAVIAAYAIVQVSYAIMRLPGRRTSPSLLMSTGFLVFIIIGALVLMLPKCTYSGISFFDSLFISTSAVCITGLTPVDVATTFTPLGILVLGMLIEIGALGVITFTSFFATFFTGSSSIFSQLVIRDVIYSKSMSSLMPTLLYVFATTFVVQAIGAVLIYIAVPPTLNMSIDEKIIFAIFNSVSAFCNAGFCNLPRGLSNTALMMSNQWLYWVFSFIIIAGAIGFPIIVNVKDALHLKLRSLRSWLRLRRDTTAYNKPVHLVDMNTKIVFTTFSILFVIGAVWFFISEYDNTLAGMTLWQKVSQSVFNSATPRSAGFSSVNPADFMPVTLVMVMFMMWVGGSAQSTAGGIKVNALAAIFLNLRSIITGHERVTAFKRTIAFPSIRRANAVVAISILSYVLFATIMLALEPKLSTRDLLFETCSALFTVGSSLGITASLGIPAKMTLCCAMFLGRVGIISLLTGIAARRGVQPHYPTDNIIIN